MSNFKINHIKASYMRLLVVLFLLCYLLVIAWLFLGCCLVVSWLLLGCSLGFLKLCYIHYSFYIYQYLCLYYNINKSWHMNFFLNTCMSLAGSNIGRVAVPMKQSITYVFATMTVIRMFLRCLH